MRKANVFTVLFCISYTLLISACDSRGPDNGQEATAVETTQSREVEPKEIFANDYVKVVKVSLAPGEALTPHVGQDRVIYSLTDYTILWEEKGQDQGLKTWKAGDVHAHEAGQHSAQNNGDTKAEWLAFVKKSQQMPDCGNESLQEDINAVAQEYATVRLDNESFRVTEVKLPPSALVPQHSGVHRLVYSLSDYQIRYESDKVEPTEKSFRQGDLHWHEACTHALENTGENEAHFLVVAFKKRI